MFVNRIRRLLDCHRCGNTNVNRCVLIWFYVYMLCLGVDIFSPFARTKLERQASQASCDCGSENAAVNPCESYLVVVENSLSAGPFGV